MAAYLLATYVAMSISLIATFCHFTLFLFLKGIALFVFIIIKKHRATARCRGRSTFIFNICLLSGLYVEFLAPVRLRLLPVIHQLYRGRQ